MKASSKPMRYGISFLLALAGIIVWLALPNLQPGQANSSRSMSGTAQRISGDGLDAEQRAALEKLLAQLKAGMPFSEEETYLLRRFEAGETLSRLEADVVSSRALYDYYVKGVELTREQSVVFDQYSQSVSRRTVAIRDLKTQLLNRRIAAAAATPPRNTPLVAPSNDLCSGAEVVPAAGPFPYLTAVTADITDATVTGDPPAPSCPPPGAISRSIWYSFTPSTAGTYTIATCADAPTGTTVDDPLMAIYTSSSGCAGPFTELSSSGGFDGCSDDDCVTGELQPVITTQLNAGTTYYVVVWQFGSAAPTAGMTAIQLRFSRVVPAANDTCAAATALSLFTPVNGTTVAGLNDYQLSGAACFTGIGQTSSTAAGRDVVYSFTAATAGSYSFKVTNFDPLSNLVLYAASSCPGATPGTPVTVATCLAASNRGATSTAEEIACLSLTAGQQIFLFVDENVITGGSTFTIEATRCNGESEPNDTPATADPLARVVEGAIAVAGDVDFFTLGTPPTGARVFAMIDGGAANSTDFDLRVTTTTDTLEYDDSNSDPPFGGLSPAISGTPTTGAATFLRVSMFSAGSTAEPYRLYAIVQPPIASATAESEPNNTTAQADAAPNNYFSGSLAGPAPSTDQDVYSFTAAAGSLIFIGLDGDPTRDNTPINGKLELLDSSGTNVLVAVNDSGSTSSTASGAGSLTSTTPNSPAESLVFRVMTSGTYYARVSIGAALVSGGSGDYLLSIFVAAPTAAKFDNDTASAASAVRYSDGASVRWQTGYEVENLGFNVYRDDAGRRTRVNSQLIAGSALMVGNSTALSAGRSYAWFDRASTAGSQYWVEAIDLKGQSTWQGPIGMGRAPGKLASLSQSPTLGELGRDNVPDVETARVERRQSIKSVAAADITVQPNLAGQSAAKLAVTGEGFYRISLSELAAAGFNAGADLRNLQLFVDGEQIPINLNAKSDGSTAVEFYGVGVESAFTTEHVYWLVNGSQPGLRMQPIAAPALGVTVGSFLYSAELKPRSIYVSSLRNGDKENFFGPVISSSPIDQSLNLQHVDKANAGAAQIEVALQGLTLTGHRVEVQVNGARVGEVVFSNQDSGIAQLQVAQSLLKEGANLVRLVPLGGASDISLVDYLRITYWHTLVADHNQLRFTASYKQAIGVDGFSSSKIRVFDVTSPNAAQEIVGTVKATKTGYSVSVNVPVVGLRTLVAIADDGARRPAGVKLNLPSNWRQAAQAANYVIITQREMMSAFEALKELRQQQGYKVALVDIEDVYDEFSYGNKTPQAVKEFLSYAAGNWKTAPRYVVLGGDASYDPKDYMGLGSRDQVPTKLIDTAVMETASDDALADFDGDGLAEMAIGRLPVRTAAEASAMAAKIVSYEQAAQPEGILLVADVDDGSDGTSFEAASDELHSLIPASQRVEQINRGDLDPAAAKGRLLDALNRGQRIVSYYGHANVNTWRNNLLTADDAAQLANGGNLSLFVMMTCLNGYFQDPAVNSLAESLMKAKGGAVAVWASAGMTMPGDQAVMNNEMFRRLLTEGSALTVGDAALKAKGAVHSNDARRTWILFGDPATKLR